MLTEIKLTNFKCFKEETAIPLSKFNLFTGVNGAGKSTALQSLLLMRQSIEHDPYTTELLLNGSCVNLGNFDDVRNRNIPKENNVIFEFSCSTNKDICFIKNYLKPKSDEMSLLVFEINIFAKFFSGEELKIESHTFKYDYKNGLYYDDSNKSYSSFVLNTPVFLETTVMESQHLNINDFFSSFYAGNIHFISADRIGPQEFYFKSTLPEFRHVGTKGEFAVNLLDKLAQELVNETLCLGDDARTLITQTQAWLGKILNPVTVRINPLRVNILELLIDGFKPSNVGFGYSSILPIVVTGLIAKPNEKIIIENPEIHLHPKAQSALIDFLVKVANTGVQIFIESHSDHVLNALRIATKNKVLKPDDVNILFFTQENGNSKIIKPTIDDNGRIDNWPESFFDETAKSLASLAAGQRPRIKAPKAEI